MEKEALMSLSVRKRGILLGCALALFFLLSLILLWIQFSRAENGRIARITQEGHIVAEIDLSSVREPYTIRIDGEDGAYNVITVRPGSIGVTEASCPDHICMQTGFIEEPLLPITCLPNRLVIQIFPES